MKNKVSNICWDCQGKISKKGICNCNRNVVKSTHGGYREGSGRKKKEPTKVIRVPETLLAKIENLIKEHKTKQP